MNKLFVDTDVILDLLGARIPHFHFAALLFTYADKKQIKLFTSPLVLANTFYILRKQLGSEDARKAIRKLRTIVSVVESSEKAVDLALNSRFTDFEDAIQYYTALERGLTAIITRNGRDFKVRGIPVLSPEIYLSSKGYL